MATNNYFNNYPSSQITSEQLLVEDLVIEAMQIYGMDIFYLPRSSRDEVDFIYGEDSVKQYVTAYPIEMYLENVTGMDGEQDFISKFGLEIRDEITLLVSRRRFKATVPQFRPNEGDLIYIPLLRNLFEVTFVEHENDQAMFYTLGRGRGGNVYVYGIKLKQYVFSNEVISTGVSEIDDQIREHYPRTKIALNSGTGTFINDEIVYQGSDLANATASAYVYDFVPNTQIHLYRTIGSFAPGKITGNTSNAVWSILSSDDLLPMDTAFEDIQDNNRFKTESESYIDFSEINPFGEIITGYRISLDSTKISMDNLITNPSFFEKTKLTMDNQDLT